MTNILLIGGIFLVGGVAIYVQKRCCRKLERRHALDPFTLGLFDKICTGLIVFMGGMLMIQILGIDVIPILTVSGIGAAILGFASRDIVANFFGGIMIYLSRPFVVHDAIELPGKQIKGQVEEIGWYFTTISDEDQKVVYVPNSLFSTELLINASRRPNSSS